MVRSLRGRPVRVDLARGRTLWTLGALLLVFTVVRNLPFGAAARTLSRAVTAVAIVQVVGPRHRMRGPAEPAADTIECHPAPIAMVHRSASTVRKGAARVSVLDEIIDGVRADLAERQARVSLDELKERAAKAPRGQGRASPRCAATASR